MTQSQTKYDQFLAEYPSRLFFLCTFIFMSVCVLVCLFMLISESLSVYLSVFSSVKLCSALSFALCFLVHWNPVASSNFSSTFFSSVVTVRSLFITAVFSKFCESMDSSTLSLLLMGLFSSSCFCLAFCLKWNMRETLGKNPFLWCSWLCSRGQLQHTWPASRGSPWGPGMLPSGCHLSWLSPGVGEVPGCLSWWNRVPVATGFKPQGSPPVTLYTSPTVRDASVVRGMFSLVRLPESRKPLLSLMSHHGKTVELTSRTSGQCSENP